VSADFLAAPRPTRWWHLTLVVIAALVLGVVVVAATRGGARPVASPTPSESPAPTRSVSTPAEVPVAEPLRLVSGRKNVDDVAMGYPQSVAGAVSAAVEYWTQIGSTLDPDRARRIGERIAARSWTNAGDDLAQGPVNTRRQLGLPAKGPLPPGASVSLGPVAYQLRDAHASRVTVLLLAYLITTTPAVGTQSRLGVFPASMRFERGDWRVDNDNGATDYGSLQAPPGSAQARVAGWSDFLQ
jgi:hypothetical protein